MPRRDPAQIIDAWWQRTRPELLRAFTTATSALMQVRILLDSQATRSRDSCCDVSAAMGRNVSGAACGN